MTDVFLSYSRNDGEVAEELHRLLESEGISCWKDNHDIVASTDYFEAITKNIRDCRAVVFLASRHSNESDWCKRELAVAREDYARPVIPVRLDDSPLPRVWIGSVQAVNLFQSTDGLFQALRAANIRFDSGPLLLSVRRQRTRRRWLVAAASLLLLCGLGWLSVRLSTSEPVAVYAQETELYADISAPARTLLVAVNDLRDATIMFINKPQSSVGHRRHQVEAMNDCIEKYNEALKAFGGDLKQNYENAARALDLPVSDALLMVLQAVRFEHRSDPLRHDLTVRELESMRAAWSLVGKQLETPIRALDSAIKNLDQTMLDYARAHAQASKPLLRCDVQGLVGASRPGRP